MSKDSVQDYSTNAASNTDIAGLNIDEGCAPGVLNNAIRAQMAHLAVLLPTLQATNDALTSLAALSTAADKMPYTTGEDTYAVADLTAAGRALLDDLDAAAQRATLGLGTAATLNAGTAADQVIQLDADAKLPAVDGSALTGLATSFLSNTEFTDDPYMEFDFTDSTANALGYKFAFRNVSSPSVNRELRAQLKVAGAWVTASEYSDGSYAQVIGEVDNSFSGDVLVFSPHSIAETHILANVMRNTNGSYQSGSNGSAHTTSVAVEAVRFYWSSGNFTDGSCTVQSLGSQA